MLMVETRVGKGGRLTGINFACWTTRWENNFEHVGERGAEGWRLEDQGAMESVMVHTWLFHMRNIFRHQSRAGGVALLPKYGGANAADCNHGSNGGEGSCGVGGWWRLQWKSRWHDAGQ